MHNYVNQFKSSRILPASKGIFLWTVEPVRLTNDPVVQHIINK